MKNHPLIEEVLITKEQIDARVKEIAAQISKDYKDKKLILIALLKGSWVYLADLLRAMTIDAPVEFMVASSYGNGTVSSGNLTIVKDLNADVKGKDVLIVEDIVDTGTTLNAITHLFCDRQANSVEITTLLSKPSRRLVDIHVDYIGFEIPDKFVVGYGLDYDERFRGFDCIGVLKEEVYKN